MFAFIYDMINSRNRNEFRVPELPAQTTSGTSRSRGRGQGRGGGGEVRPDRGYHTIERAGGYRREQHPHQQRWSQNLDEPARRGDSEPKVGIICLFNRCVGCIVFRGISVLPLLLLFTM